MYFDKPYGIKSSQLMPELEDTKDRERFLKILNPSLQDFTKLCLKHAGVEISDFALLACTVMCDLGTYRGIFDYNKAADKYIPMDALQTMIVAIMLHDIYIDEKHLATSVFKAREEFWDIGKNPDNFNGNVMNDTILGQIFQCIEGQFGPATPVEGSIPVRNSPQEDVSTAIYITKFLTHWNTLLK